MLSFAVGKETVKVAPLSIYAVLKEVHSMRRFQLLSYPEGRLELRLEPTDGVERELAFEQAKLTLLNYLGAQGVKNVSVTLSCDAPKQQAGSGKFKHILQIE